MNTAKRPPDPCDGSASVTFREIEAAAERLLGHAHRTPVVTSQSVNAITRASVFFKCENFQRAGAFKFRGAYNAVAQLSMAERTRGVLAYSSGNHAQAVALAGRLLGVPITVVMPADAPAVKLAATLQYGAEIVTYDRARTVREELAREIAQARNLSIVPPYDHPHVVAGQGTSALELFEEIGSLDLLLVPCGGGGLLSGSALVAKAVSPSCRVVGVEPARADDATRSFRTKTLESVREPETIADGARTPSLGAVTFPLVLRCVDDMVTVSEEGIVQAMVLLWERLKIVVEPTGALSAAAMFEKAVDTQGLRIGVIVSGGNVDLAQLAPILQTLTRPSDAHSQGLIQRGVSTNATASISTSNPK